MSAKSPRESRRKKSVSGSLARPSERRGKSVSIAPLAASDGTRTRGRGQARGTPGTSRLGREGQESRSTFHGASSRAIVPRPTAEASILAFEALALRRGRASSEDNALVPDGDAGAEPNFGRSRAVAALSSPG